jgi:colanic acid biosynthesis glycosyl transferase WcaI
LTKRILLYGINFAPELTGIGKYTGELAAWLAERGHQVRVVTAPPYYPAWKIAAGFKNGWRTEIINPSNATARGGIRHSLVVYRCPLWVPAQPGGLKRLMHLASFALSSLLVMLRQVLWRPDVVWVVEPALFCAPTAVAVARLCGAKVWLHVQDFEVDAAFDLGLLKRQLVRRWVTVAERGLMRRFDVVSTISQHMHQRLLNKGVEPAQALLAPNWVDLAQFALPSSEGVAAYRRELGITNGAVMALYSGNMGGKQGLELLADVAQLCSEVAFVFCGNGAGRADLVARCAGLTNVRFLDLQPAERLPNLLATADIHLLPQRAEAANLVMPSKLTGMLASARPVVATAHPGTELANVVQTCGLVVPPGNAVAFAHAVRTLAGDAALRETLGATGFLYAQHHLNREAVLQKFESDLLAIIQN